MFHKNPLFAFGVVSPEKVSNMFFYIVSCLLDTPIFCIIIEKPFLMLLVLQQRNLYNKIFGGYLMRKAFELAFANASLIW